MTMVMIANRNNIEFVMEVTGRTRREIEQKLDDAEARDKICTITMITDI